MSYHLVHAQGQGNSRSSIWELYIDGAARNNPGESGAGVYLLQDGVPKIKQGVYLGIKTNNQAEYIALLLGLFYVRQYICPYDRLLIKSDSELLVRQMNGVYSVKNKELAQLYACAQQLLKDTKYSIIHVIRSANKIADNLANKGIDKKITMPIEFFTLLEQL
jgi:ribonuclease HI